MSNQREESIPVARAWAIVSDLRPRKMWVYWLDFLGSVTLGWSAFAFAVASPVLSFRQGVLCVVAGFALYRAVIFTHELAHAPLDTLKSFRAVWNLLCGFPLLVPSFTYRGVHRDHHRRDLYGKREDGEYVPFAIEAPYKIVLYLLLPVVLPLLFVARFLILVPLSYLNRSVRRFSWQRASSLTIDLSYERPLPSAEEEPVWKRQELAAFGFVVGAIALVALQLVAIDALLVWYQITVLILFVNSLRTLVAHRYQSNGDRTLEIDEQFLDSIDIPGHPIFTPLWAPVGLRYHATHHLFPRLPYHALGAAHRRLAQQLPDSAYLEATRSGLLDALARLWVDAGESRVESDAELGLPS